MKLNKWVIIASINLILLLTMMFVFNQRTEAKAAEYEAQLADQKIVNEGLRREIYWYEIKKPPVYTDPLPGAYMEWVSSPVGYRVDPMGGEDAKFHKGIDIGADIGTIVRVMADGIVVAHWVPPDGVYWKGHPIYGGYVIVDHGDGLFSMYGHLSKTYIHEGNEIKSGHIIGLVGKTGMATGPHLHWEIAIDPTRYIREIL